MIQSEKAQHFKSLHVKGKPLVLYNIWDAGGANTLAEAGARAIATGSWSVAAAHGYDDGEMIPLEFLLKIVSRIAATLDLPLTVDFEGGYARDPEAVTANLRRVIAAGAVGVNFEDQIVNGTGLYTIADQAARIRAVRRAAESEGIGLFINARTDLFLQAEGPDDHADLIQPAIERAAAYAEAGADGFFVPGLSDPDLIRQVCAQTPLPVNVMMMGDLVSVDAAAPLGVARISFGPAPYRAAMGDLADRFRRL